MSDDKYEGLPPAVRRQAEEADKKIADLEKTRQTPPEPPPAEPPVESPVPENPPQPPNTPPDDNQPPAEPPAPPTPPREDWKQKFLTLQGKYNAEVPRLHEEINAARALIAEQTQQLTEVLRQQPAPSQPPADPAAPPKRRFVTDQEVETLGPELADQQERVLSRAIDPLQNELKATRQHIEQMNKRVFFGDLTMLVPDWRTINKNEDFLRWLGEPDPMNPRRTRDDALQDASGWKDADAAASIFGLFVETHPDVFKPPASDGGVPPPSGPSAPKKEDLVQPPRQRGAPPAAPQKKTWKTSELATFAREVSRRLWDARPQEAARIQAEIDLAIKEGRVVKDT